MRNRLLLTAFIIILIACIVIIVSQSYLINRYNERDYNNKLIYPFTIAGLVAAIVVIILIIAILVWFVPKSQIKLPTVNYRA